MAVRLGTQDWINPAPFQAAAEMVVDAGRATGAGIAALGAGIGQGLQNRQARQERAQNRQDALNQRGIDNARADRAEARMLKQSKLAASESILAAKKMEYEMSVKMHELMGTPETEAAMLKAQQGFREANNWYHVSVGNNAEIEPPQAGVTDYLGVGGGGGVRVDGKSMSQMTDAELDDFMAKSERGEVDYTYRGGATGDMGQGVGNVAPSSQQASMEAAAELVSATDFARAATKKRQQAVDVMATGKTRENRAKADKLKLEAEFLEFEAQRRGQQETAKASAENTRANQAADDERQAARLTADARSAGYKGEPFQTKDAALKWLEANKQIGVMDARNAFTALRDEKKAAILSAYREKTFGLKREAMDLAQAKFELEKAGDASAASKADARLSKTWNDVADYAEQVLREYQFVTGAENLPEVQEARKLQAEAGRELIKLARDSMKPKAAATAPVVSDTPPSFVPPDMVEDWKKMTPEQKDKVKKAFGGG